MKYSHLNICYVITTFASFKPVCNSCIHALNYNYSFETLIYLRKRCLQASAYVFSFHQLIKINCYGNVKSFASQAYNLSKCSVKPKTNVSFTRYKMHNVNETVRIAINTMQDLPSGN